MKRITSFPKDTNPVRLVWLITMLSFFVGVFMVTIVWKTLTDIRIEREKVFRLKENFTSVRALHEKHLVQERLELSRLLEGDVEAGAFPKTSQIFRLVDEYRKVASSLETSEVLEQLEESLLALTNLRNQSLIRLKIRLTGRRKDSGMTGQRRSVNSGNKKRTMQNKR